MPARSGTVTVAGRRERGDLGAEDVQALDALRGRESAEPLHASVADGLSLLDELVRLFCFRPAIHMHSVPKEVDAASPKPSSSHPQRFTRLSTSGMRPSVASIPQRRLCREGHADAGR